MKREHRQEIEASIACDFVASYLAGRQSEIPIDTLSKMAVIAAQKLTRDVGKGAGNNTRLLLMAGRIMCGYIQHGDEDLEEIAKMSMLAARTLDKELK